MFQQINYSLSYLGGKQPYDILKLHEKYGTDSFYFFHRNKFPCFLWLWIGPVVRTAPNELSFSSPQSWQDIYGARKRGAVFLKSSFYDGGNFANQAHSIVSERDPIKHSGMRKFLSSAFSDRSLREQEYLVSEVVDEFIKQIGVRGSKTPGIDMTLWMNLLTFDIIAQLGSSAYLLGGKDQCWYQYH